MQLSPTEAEHFFRLFKPLLVYVNQQLSLIEGLNTTKDLESYPLESIAKIRNKLYKHPELFARFIDEKSQEFTTDDLATVQSWTNFLRGNFYIFRYLKKHAIFLNTDEPYKAYGVLSLYESFPEILGYPLPKLVETVLLPFQGKIISDGIFTGPNVLFGSSYRNSLKTCYEEAIARFGLITSLEKTIQEIGSSDVAKLKAYLKNEKNRSEYWTEIQSLQEKSLDLKVLYFQEMGKIWAKKYSRQWREIGLQDIWFAFLESTPIASGKTKASLEQTLNEILSPDRHKFVYIFHLK